MSDGFLGRWSRRKQEVREGKPLEEPAPAPALAEPALTTAPQMPQVAAVGQTPSVPATAPPAPTLEDVQALTTESDFKPFMARNVDPEVKNAAMKKLFEDPHYNVMDRLDTYIDDYSRPDPLPDSMLRQMASAKFLNLFEEDEKIDPETNAAATARNPTPPPAAPQALSPATEPATNPPTMTDDHANTDLRLQQDHAAGPEGPGHGAG
jgi:hypothetical protein